MSKNKEKQQRPQALKQKLMSALAMLLVATTLMASTTYAWFVLSTAPEVTGIETQVGANGSLEIALLNTETRADLSTIRAGLGGGSLQENKMAANNVWGNLVDLSFAEYGLGELVLMPARLNSTDGTSIVDRSPLAVPSYGYDGRIIELDKSTGSAILQEGGFLYSAASQTYGVRAIGSADGTTVQSSYLGAAQTTVKNSAKKAQADTRAVLNENGPDLIESVLVKYALSASSTYGDADKAVLMSMLTGLEGVLNNVDSAFRQSLVAYAASQLDDEDTFEAARGQIMNKDVALSSLLSQVSGLPSEFSGWINRLDEMQNNLNAAMNACEELTSGSYTWSEIKNVLSYIMSMDGISVNNKSFDQISQSDLTSGEPINILLAPGSGLFADIADFSGNYNATFAAMGGIVEVVMETASRVSPAYLVSLYDGIDELTPAAGDNSAPAKALKATYGYAIDLAFRCNAADPDLVLQTKGVQRIYSSDEDTANSGTQGAGSYMEFTSMDSNFTPEQRLALMDAIRVGFVDEQGSILGIAKLNIADRSSEKGGVVRAPLYMYDYSFEQDDVSGGLILTMGERKLTDNLITELRQNEAMAVTAIVWLDGDIVDNTMVSATAATSLNGVLNLQFATSAELVPANEGQVMSYASNRSGLELAVSDAKVTVDGTQGTYTNVSWNNFMDAYNRALAVKENQASGHIEIENALAALTAAEAALTPTSNDALNEKIAEIRKLMGNTNEVVRYAIRDDDGNFVLVGDQPHTQDELNEWKNNGVAVYGVDYMGKNVVNEKDAENNDTTIRTTKYTDESWNALAEALYLAEAYVKFTMTDDAINEQLTALEYAQKNLEFAAYFTPYEYNGDLYYQANYVKDGDDTYGSWYDAEFKRIISDVLIMKLDAYAKDVDIAVLGQEEYVPSNQQYLTTDIKFLQEVFPELQDVKPKGIYWSGIDSTLFTELMGTAHYNKMKELIHYLDTDPVLQHDPADAATERAAVEALMGRFDNNEEIPVADARTAINNFKTKLAEMYETNQKAIAAAEPGYVEKLQMPAALTFADVEFDIPYSGTRLKLTGGTGTTKLSAKVLTEDGVVIDVSTDITVYLRADSAQLAGGATSLDLTVGTPSNVTAELVFSSEGTVKETIKSIRWASSNTDVATVAAGSTAAAGKITPVAAGNATITGTVTTDAGKTYSISVRVTVS